MANPDENDPRGGSFSTGASRQTADAAKASASKAKASSSSRSSPTRSKSPAASKTASAGRSSSSSSKTKSMPSGEGSAKKTQQSALSRAKALSKDDTRESSAKKTQQVSSSPSRPKSISSGEGRKTTVSGGVSPGGGRTGKPGDMSQTEAMAAQAALAQMPVNRGLASMLGMPTGDTQAPGQLARDALLGKRQFGQAPMLDAAGNVVGQYSGEAVTPGTAGMTPAVYIEDPSFFAMPGALPPIPFPEAPTAMGTRSGTLAPGAYAFGETADMYGDVGGMFLPSGEQALMASRFRPMLEPQAAGQAPTSVPYSPAGLPNPSGYDIGYTPPGTPFTPEAMTASPTTFYGGSLNTAYESGPQAGGLSGSAGYMPAGQGPTLGAQSMGALPQVGPAAPNPFQAPSAQMGVPPMLEEILPGSPGVRGAFPEQVGPTGDARTYGDFAMADPMMTASPERLDVSVPARPPTPTPAAPQVSPYLAQQFENQAMQGDANRQMVPGMSPMEMDEILQGAPVVQSDPTPTPVPATQPVVQPLPSFNLNEAPRPQQPATAQPATMPAQQIAADTGKTQQGVPAAVALPGVGPLVGGIQGTLRAIGDAITGGRQIFGEDGIIPPSDPYTIDDFMADQRESDRGSDRKQQDREESAGQALVDKLGKGGGGYTVPVQQQVNAPYIPPTVPVQTPQTPTPAYRSYNDLMAAAEAGYPMTMAGGGMVRPSMTNAFTPGSYYAMYDPRKRGLGGM